MKTNENGKSVYQIVTEQIVHLLEKGTIPWRQPWGKKESPQNLLNRIPYRGINMMLLSAFNFERNLFLTFNQIKDLSVALEKGAKPLPVVFWKWPEPKEESEESEDEKKAEAKVRPILRYYSVYNISQVKNIPEKLIPPIAIRENNPIESCALLVENMLNQPKIQFIDPEAYYSPSRDVVNVPDMKLFESSEAYYGTLFHELIHSTGHENRLNRKEGMAKISYGSEAYSQEELVAEIGACYLEAHAGISAKNIDNNAAYIDGWLQRLKKDTRFIFFASAYAQRAADYIINPFKRNSHPQVPMAPVQMEVSKKAKKKGAVRS